MTLSRRMCCFHLTPHKVLKFASLRLKASREETFDALQGELSDSHRFVLDELMRHLEEIKPVSRVSMPGCSTR